MDIEQLEALALAEDRSGPLAQLIPGTEDDYFHRCLEHQVRGELDAVLELVKIWVQRHGETARVREIRDRQALLAYRDETKDSLEHIRRRLNLTFDHQRETQAAERELPTRLDPAAISREAFLTDALRRHHNLDGVRDRALDWLAQDESLPLPRLRALLTRLQRPDVPKLVDHVLRELRDQHSSGFGSLTIHARMTTAQLDALAAAEPKLLSEARFVHARLARMLPGPDLDLDADAEARRAQLDALWAFVEPLADAFNSLKLHVLHHRLDHDRRHGVFDRDRFDRYVRLPRAAAYVAVEYRRAHDRALAQFGQNFQAATGLATVYDDTELLRDYLGRIFVDPQLKHFDAFRPYLDGAFLRRVFAEAKILAGVGDQERWYSMLDDPGYYGQLERRVDIELCLDNPKQIGADAPVELSVELKHVPRLIVKVFEINAAAYYQAHQRAVDTGVDLDGLVANHERVIELDEAPLRRVRRTLCFPEIDRPGTYVIELIGGGKSSRALIRKGGLRYVERLDAAGHLLTILDEDDRPLADASVWLGGREFQPDEAGEIRLPYLAGSAREVKLLLRHARAASVASFKLRPERYEFHAGFHVAREQLIAGRSAQLLIRPALMINGVHAPLSLLEQTKLTITSRDRHGTSSSLSLALELRAEAETCHVFKVPEALHELSFELTAKVRSVTEQREVELRAHASTQINEIDRGSEVAGLHLAKTAAGYLLQALGKSGEPRSGLQVNLGVDHQDFCAQMRVALRTDDRGRVELGALVDVTAIEATLGDGGRARWVLPRPTATLPRSFQLAADEALTLPNLCLDPAHAHAHDPAHAHPVRSLLERRGDGYLRERLDAVSLEHGAIVIRGLEPGDYELILAHDRVVRQLRVGGTARAGGWALSARRHLQRHAGPALRIRELGLDDAGLRVRVAGADADTRVHVFASRFVAASSAAADLDRWRLAEGIGRAVKRSRCDYLSGRDIGDEYRYILDRRQAGRFAGNMVERPGLLLNPWAVRGTSTGLQQAKGGAAYDAMKADAYGMMDEPSPVAEPASVAGAPSNNLDFLPRSAHVALNLAPNADGLVTVEREELDGLQLVEVVVVSGEGLVSGLLALPEAALAPEDLRLRDGLDPDRHFVKRKRQACLAVGDELVLEDIRTAKLEAVDSLAKAFGLICTIAARRGGEGALREFEFVTRWPSLSPEDQRERYSKYACHELNLLLSRKDPAFFSSLVAPYLANKRDKTFMDHYLLGAELRPYLEPWAYGRLNTLERLLLAGRLDDERGPGTRHVKDRVELLPPDVEGDNAAFDTALQGSVLDSEDDGFGLAAMQAEIAVGSSADFGSGGGGGFGGPPMMAPPAPQSAPGGPPPPPRAPAPPPAARPSPKRARRASKAKAMPAQEEERERGGGGRGRADEAVLAARAEAQRFYRAADKTKEWAENNYYQVTLANTGPELIGPNNFWRDFAEHLAAGGEGPFLSGEFLRAAEGTLAERLCALALLDLPFEAEAPDKQLDGARLSLRAKTPLIAFHEQITAVEASGAALGVLVSQNYFRADDRYRYEGNERHDKYVEGELLVHTVYLCQVVLTNPSSSAHKLELLLQIPRGAMPVANGFETRDVHVHLAPHGTHAIEYAFYFPAPGTFAHFPVHVAQNGELRLFAEARGLELVTALRSVDEASWSHVSQHADSAALLRYLDTNNLERLDLGRIAWRMRERAVFEAVLELARRRHVYAEVLWSYAVHHGDERALAEYLRHQDAFLRGCGLAIDAPILRVEPVARSWYQHLEYAPLINARAHQLGPERKILNRDFAQQYRAFLTALLYQAQVRGEQLLAAAYYAFLQDRVADALALLERVGDDALSGRLQHDYLRAYAALYRGDAAAARALAAPHLGHGVDRWRKRFAALVAVLDEAEGARAEIVDADDRDQEQAQLSARAPALEFEVEGSAITLDYQNLAACTISYYRMDIELLFSRQPFLKDQSSRFSIVQPNHSERVDLAADANLRRVELPVDYRGQNTIIEVSGGGVRRSRANYAHQLRLQMIESYGQLRVHAREGGAPLPRAYVKVYARKHGGEVGFYKDGYTDIRGAFDYASLSTNELEQVERFAVLVMDDERGALIREAAPPQH